MIPLLVIIVVILLSTGLSPCHSQSVTIYTQPSFRGSALTLNISSCVGTLPPPFLNGGTPLLNSINTQGYCAQLYKRENCTGDYLIVKPGTQHDYLEGYGWANSTFSVGPCYPKCHKDNIQSTTGLSTQERSITITPAAIIFRLLGMDTDRVRPITLPIPINGCVDSPTNSTEWKAIQTARVRVNTLVCVEAHLLPSCQGSTYRLTLGKVPRREFEFQLRLDQFKSFSFCGYDCQRDNITDAIDHKKELELHSAYLCGTKEYQKTHECHNVTQPLQAKLTSTTSTTTSIPMTNEVEERPSITTDLGPGDKEVNEESYLNASTSQQRNSKGSETRDSSGSLVGPILISLSVLVILFVGAWAAVVFYRHRKDNDFRGQIYPKRSNSVRFGRRIEHELLVHDDGTTNLN